MPENLINKRDLITVGSAPFITIVTWAALLALQGAIIYFFINNSVIQKRNESKKSLASHI